MSAEITAQTATALPSRNHSRVTMDARRSPALRAILIGVAITLGGAVCLGAWRYKESVPDHAADIAAIDAKIQRILDLMCDRPENTTKRQCGQ